MASAQFDELNDILDLVYDTIINVEEALREDGKIGVLEWVSLAFNEASDLIHVALNADGVVADSMSKEETLVLLQKIITVGKTVAGFLSKK